MRAVVREPDHGAVEFGHERVDPRPVLEQLPPDRLEYVVGELRLVEDPVGTEQLAPLRFVVGPGRSDRQLAHQSIFASRATRMVSRGASWNAFAASSVGNPHPST